MERIMAKENDLMQHENLSDMVKHGATEDPIAFSEENLDMPESQEVQEVAQEETQSSISITSLSDWIDSNVDNFPNIKKPQVTVQSVDLKEQLILSVLISSEGGVEKRRLELYNDAHLQPVLDLPAIDMQIYNNSSFRIIYDLGNGIFVKSYGVRTGLISVFCNDIDNQLIPYAIVRAKKKDTQIEVPTQDANEVRQKLNQNLDFEALQLRYKQSSKTDGFPTNKEAIDWLIERQSGIVDVHHHLHIDNVIIDTLG
jgi:hypothetical protein